MFRFYENDLSRYQGIMNKFTIEEDNKYSNGLNEMFKKYPELKDEFCSRPEDSLKQTSVIVRILRSVFRIGIAFSIFYFSFKTFVYFQKMEVIKMSDLITICLIIAGAITLITGIIAFALYHYNKKVKSLQLAGECCKAIINNKYKAKDTTADNIKVTVNDKIICAVTEGADSANSYDIKIQTKKK